MKKIKEDKNEELFLSINNLTVEYKSGDKVVRAVNGVSFDIKHGRTLGLVGETGAGKTTIAKSILRILQQPPAKITEGEIFLDGTDLLKLSEHAMKKIRGQKISMIFQDPMTALNPVMTIGDQIAEVIRIHNKILKEQAFKKAVEMLEMIGIPAERYNEYPHQFSGGMKQRIVIAMALACDPELLLADEPTTALDVTIQAQVLDLINKLKREYGTAMIMITHDLGVVAEVCDDVAVIYAGQIIESGSLEEIYDYPMHPYTKGLFGAIPDLDIEIERLIAIPGASADPTDLPPGCHFNPRCTKATDECKKLEIPLIECRPGHFCRCINLETVEE